MCICVKNILYITKTVPFCWGSRAFGGSSTRITSGGFLGPIGLRGARACLTADERQRSSSCDSTEGFPTYIESPGQPPHIHGVFGFAMTRSRWDLDHSIVQHYWVILFASAQRKPRRKSGMWEAPQLCPKSYFGVSLFFLFDPALLSNTNCQTKRQHEASSCFKSCLAGYPL